MLNNFKWYRALRGGVWYKHIRESYTYESGIGAMLEYEKFWNRDSENSVETEDYRTENEKLMAKTDDTLNKAKNCIENLKILNRL